MRRFAGAALAFALPTCLLLHNARASVDGAGLSERLQGWRGWDDLAIATAFHVSGEYPVAHYQIANRFRRDLPDFVAFRDKLLLVVARTGVRAHQFWRTIPSSDFEADERHLARRWDDPGRALLLSLGFTLLGGASPFLVCWLGVLLAAPLVGCLGCELFLAGRRVAAFMAPLVLAASAFLVDVLMLGYSSAGFSLGALLVVLVLAVYALGGRPTRRGLLIRCLLAGSLFGWFALGRNASLLSLPAVLLVLAFAARRAGAAEPTAGRPARRWLLWIAAVAVFLAPYVLFGLMNERLLDRTVEQLRIQRKPVQRHDVWITLWQGLGDFDRSKGHVFLDQAGAQEARRHGSPERLSPQSEQIFRGLVLRDIREDPGWFAAILARRLWATVTLAKLRPFEAWDGLSYEPATHEAEGVTDNYYRMTARADFVRLGSRTRELPLALLFLPMIGLVCVALLPAPRLAPARAEARVSLGVVACLALAALPAPVLITTASAFETQSFVLVPLASVGLLAQALAAIGPSR